MRRRRMQRSVQEQTVGSGRNGNRGTWVERYLGGKLYRAWGLLGLKEEVGGRSYQGKARSLSWASGGDLSTLISWFL